MNNNHGNYNLPMQTLNEIPTPHADAREIVALIKNKGKVSGYKMSDGSVLAKQDAVALAKQGGIQGVGISLNKNTEYLKTLPDQSEDNNLGSLPSFPINPS